MSDPATSGASTPASPDNASAAPAAGATQPFGTFGSNRGSGLLRGKRPSPATASAAPAAPAGYQPSSIAVISPKSEYKNPFTGETSVAAPVTNEPAPSVAPAPVAPPPAAPAPVAVREEVAAPAKAPVDNDATPELFPFNAPASEARAAAPAAPTAAKPELKILPPEETKRPAQSWESGSQPRRDDRPNFRPERREPRNFEPRAPRDPALEPREPRAPLPHRETPAPEAPKKSGGFFAWLKGLFGGAETAKPQEQSGDQRRDRDGEFRHGRRRHRGGRGRQNFNGPRDGQQPQGGPQEGDRPQGQGQGGEFRGERGEDGGQRRRRRGGRGRFRGDRGGDPRSDGQQGGGAI
jgi:hypothetical protein